MVTVSGPLACRFRQPQEMPALPPAETGGGTQIRKVASLQPELGIDSAAVWANHSQLGVQETSRGTYRRYLLAQDHHLTDVKR